MGLGWWWAGWVGGWVAGAAPPPATAPPPPPHPRLPLAELKWLRFADNRMRGSLPPELARLTPLLVQLTLDGNDFEGGRSGWEGVHE